MFFLKFNFSHNGTTLENPSDFDDMEAFGNNNFCIELDDLNFVIDWILNNHYFKNEININEIHLLGHSRGGAISILKSNEDKKIKSVISWASPSNLLSRLPSGDKLNTWKKTNVAYIYNSRINKNMPMYYQFYENCILNKQRLSIEKSIKRQTKPHLVIHGSEDPTVPVDDALEMKNWNNDIKLEIIEFKRDEQDTRVKHIYLNNKGKKISDEIFQTQKKRIYNALLNSKSEEVLNFDSVLHKIIDE